MQNQILPLSSSSNSSNSSKSKTWPLSLKVIIAVVLGLILGEVFKTEPIIFGIKNEHFGQIGMLVIKLLRTLATPLIFIAILEAFTKMTFTLKQGGKLLFICFFNVCVAMTIGLTLMNTFEPGKLWSGKIQMMKDAIGSKGLEVKRSEDPEAPEASLGPIKNISYHIPSSILKPFFYNNVISIVILALLAGVAFRKLKEEKLAHIEHIEHIEQIKQIEQMEKGIEWLFEWAQKMLEYVVKLIPYAVFGVVAQVVGAVGAEVFQFLWVFLITILAGLFIHSLIYYPLIAWFEMTANLLCLNVGPCLLFRKSID